MLHHLDMTLETLLKKELPRELVEQISITFASPDEQFPPTSVSLPAIDLFLYDIRENRDLRTNEWVLEINGDGTGKKRLAPVRVDCSYLITAWANASSQKSAQEEHGMLGEVMRVILRHPTIGSEFLQGDLRGQEPDMPAVSIQPGHLQSLAEFWQALGGKPKAALNYTVTLALEPFKPVDVGKLVTDKGLQFGDSQQEQTR